MQTVVHGIVTGSCSSSVGDVRDQRQRQQAASEVENRRSVVQVYVCIERLI